MNKKIFIIHGWSSFPEDCWFPWLKSELEKRNFSVTVPQMPNPDNPEINSWVTHLKNVVGELNEETYFIGHSIGCQAIMRFIEKENKKIGGAVFVAGFF